ncbi:MAG TPA: DUF1294 domain-containing protein, partial [Candidatus Absconditabacterales bacterium]|nr:DUF1294 domain-containing protein [Candidatus Absconditabacterales bacterium]
KYKAEKQQRRIKEKDLLMMTAIGGFLGAVGGMSYFRHKTIKGAFLRKFWLIVVAWMAVFFGILLQS